MGEAIYNCNGDNLEGICIRLIDPQYGFVDDANIPHINWGTETEKCDADGFDKEYRPIDGTSAYYL